MRKILVVEDEDAIREVVALNLRLAGYEVTEAASAEQALAVFSPSAGFDVAVLDIMLPGMNGFSLCETIRRDSASIGIIMLSAKTLETDKIKTPEKLAEYQKAQGAVTSALGKLLAIRESYPDLKANQNFLELQAQLEGTENRINVARKNFNDAAQSYNTNIRRFPKNIFAGMFGFDKKAYFEAEEGTEKAPKVEF